MSTEAWVSNSIAVVAAVIAIVSVCVSIHATSVARNTSYQVQITGEKSEAMSKYAQAFGDLLTAIDTRYQKIPFRFEDPQIAATFTQADMEAMHEATDGWLKEYRDYTTNVNTIRGAWPTSVQEKIILAGDAANAVSRCLGILEQKPTVLYSKFWDDKRNEIVKECAVYPLARSEFNSRSQDVINAMREDREAAWNASMPTKDKPSQLGKLPSEVRANELIAGRPETR